MWTIAAPAARASSAAAAICLGVTGSFGCCSGFTRLPVSAQEIIVFVIRQVQQVAAKARNERSKAFRCPKLSLSENLKLVAFPAAPVDQDDASCNQDSGDADMAGRAESIGKMDCAA